MCPLLDKSHPRCAAHLCLKRLEEALSVCANHYEECPVYAGIRAVPIAHTARLCEVEDAVVPG